VSKNKKGREGERGEGKERRKGERKGEKELFLWIIFK
jgi:hypothetical protein